MAPEADHDIKDDDEKNPRPLDEDDIALLKTYVIFPSFPFSFFLSFLLQTLITTMWISLFIFSSMHSFLLLLYCYAMFSCSRLDFYFFLTTTKSNYAGKLGWGDGFTSLEHFKFWI